MDVDQLTNLRATLVADLAAFMRFFDIGGVDHEHGGCCCGLSAKGTRLTGLKFVWFNGRAIWTYSRVHNSGLLTSEQPAPRGNAPMQAYLLDVAKRARDFALNRGRDFAGEFVVEMTLDGKPLAPAQPRYVPTSGYGSAFVAEGLVELFRATGDTDELDLALHLLRKFVMLMDDPTREGDAGPWPLCYPGMRTLGHHMIALNLSRQLHAAITEAAESGVLSSTSLLTAPEHCVASKVGTHAILTELTLLLDRLLEAIFGSFLHPGFGLLSECLAHDYSRPDDANEVSGAQDTYVRRHTNARSHKRGGAPSPTHRSLRSAALRRAALSLRTYAIWGTPLRPSGWSWLRLRGAVTRRSIPVPAHSSARTLTRLGTMNAAVSTAAPTFAAALALAFSSMPTARSSGRMMSAASGASTAASSPFYALFSVCTLRSVHSHSLSPCAVGAR